MATIYLNKNMLLMIPSAKIAQTISLRQTKWPPELKLEFSKEPRKVYPFGKWQSRLVQM